MTDTAKSPIADKELRAALSAATRRIVDQLDPEKVILFGSHANGVPDPDSDVDLLVVMETEASPAERIKAVSRLLSPRPFPVDIIVRTSTELARDLARVDPFIHEIIEQGIVLYERPE